jgi:hypothetical protein
LVKKKQVLGMFYVLFVRKKFFHPNLRGDSPEKFTSGKILPSPLPPPLANIFGENMKKYGKNGTVVILARIW